MIMLTYRVSLRMLIPRLIIRLMMVILVPVFLSGMLLKIVRVRVFRLRPVRIMWVPIRFILARVMIRVLGRLLLWVFMVVWVRLVIVRLRLRPSFSGLLKV